MQGVTIPTGANRGRNEIRGDCMQQSAALRMRYIREHGRHPYRPGVPLRRMVANAWLSGGIPLTIGECKHVRAWLDGRDIVAEERQALQMSDRQSPKTADTKQRGVDQWVVDQ